MQYIEVEPFKCEITQDCLGYALIFKDDKAHRSVSSIDEWLTAFNEKFAPLIVTKDTLQGFRSLLDRVYQEVYPHGQLDEDVGVRAMLDNIYLDDRWNWFGEAVTKSKTKSYKWLPYREVHNIPNEWTGVVGMGVEVTNTRG